MPNPHNNPFNLIKSPKALLVIAALSGGIGAYYFAAQTIDLPGSKAMRARWNDLTTRRGTRGHRVHSPRANGPIDLSILTLVSAASAWQGLSLHNKQKGIQS